MKELIFNRSVLTFFVITLSCVSISSAQNNKFVRKYTQIGVFDENKGDYVSLNEANNSFVFNYNSNGDVKKYTASGSVEILLSVGTVTEGETEEGDTFQYMTYLDKNGDEHILILYDNIQLGLVEYITYGTLTLIVHYFP